MPNPNMGHGSLMTATDKMATLRAQHALMVRVGADVRDPYPHLGAVRRSHPVFVAANDSPRGVGVLALGHGVVQTVLRDASRFSSSILTEALGPSTANARVLVSQDDPEHRVHRALVSRSFSSGAIDRLADDLMRPLADQLIERFLRDGHADLMAQLAFDFPAQVIAAMLGLPREDLVRFQGWTADLLAHLRDPAAAARALDELRGYVRDRIEVARVEPGPDLVSQLVAAEVEGERLSDEDIYTFVRFLLPAGVETTFRGLGNALFLLLTHPDQLDAVRSEPDTLISRAVEEALRCEVPMLVTNRVAAVDCEIGGVAIRAGTGVLAVVGSANRDEARYDHPDRFDLFRDPAPHVSLGFGAHVCLGMHLARAEMRVAIERVLAHMPGIHIDPNATDAHIEGIVFRNPAVLPVRW